MPRFKTHLLASSSQSLSLHVHEENQETVTDFSLNFKLGYITKFSKYPNFK
jgi:hypothetical protein